MSRAPTAGFNTALAAAHLEEVIFIELQFKSGTSYVCSRDRDISWNGQTWLGKGRVGSIEPLEEGAQLEARSSVMSLSAIPAGMLVTALDPTEYKNRACKLWFGLLDTSSPGAITVVADPVGPFLYRMDSLDFELGEQGALRLTAHSRLEDWQRPRIRRYNNDDQQAEYPGDKFFQFTEQMVQAEFLW